MRRTRERTAAGAGRSWISDGRGVYRRAIRRIYRYALHTGRRGRPRLIPTAGVGLVQAVKLRRGGRLVRIEVHPRFGEASECPYTVCVERLNGVLCNRLACLTRKTHAFAKDERTWDAAVGLCLFEHNWMRPLRALREREPDPSTGRRYRQRSSAMALGLTDHLWSWTEFLSQPLPG